MLDGVFSEACLDHLQASVIAVQPGENRPVRSDHLIGSSGLPERLNPAQRHLPTVKMDSLQIGIGGNDILSDSLAAGS